MARIRNRQNESLSGTIGPVVACTWLGVPYLRSLPAHTNNPRTPRQQAQRGRLGKAMNFLRPLTPVLRVGFREEALGRSAFNAAMSYTMRYALHGEREDVRLNYRQAAVSQGCLTTPARASVGFKDGQALFEWDNSSRTGNASPRDHALLVVYHKQLQQAVYETTGSQRADGLATLNYPTNWQPDDLAVYLGFWSRTEKIASNSLCLWG